MVYQGFMSGRGIQRGGLWEGRCERIHNKAVYERASVGGHIPERFTGVCLRETVFGWYTRGRPHNKAVYGGLGVGGGHK